MAPAPTLSEALKSAAPQEPETHAAFFYGTLMAAPVLSRVLNSKHGLFTSPSTSRLTIRPAILPSYTRYKVLYADYPGILPSSEPNASVRGTLVQGLSDSDIWRLDIFEGGQYERREVKVKVVEKEQGKASCEMGSHEEVVVEEVDAETYVWVAAREELDKEEWDFEEFVREKMSRWVHVDEGFKDLEEAEAALQGDPTGGRGANGSITRELEKTDSAAKDELIESAV